MAAPQAEGLRLTEIVSVRALTVDEDVFDLTTDPDHCFFASGVLVHNCTPAVQAALLRVVLERRVGDLVLPRGIRVFAAMNPPSECGGYDLMPPLANRFIWWKVDKGGQRNWGVWFLSDGGDNGDVENPLDPASEEDRVLQLWPAEYATGRGLVWGFVNGPAGMSYYEPDVPEGQQIRGWPRRRTWTVAARVIAASKIHGLTEIEQSKLLEGTVGVGASAAFEVWRADISMPNVEKLLDGEEEWKPDRTRIDRSSAVMGQCAAFLEATDVKRHDRAKEFWRIAERVCETTADVVWEPSIVVSGKLGLGRSLFRGEKDDPATRVLARLTPIRQASEG